jgi:hypothetical protein
MKETKFLYETTVKKQVEEKVTDTKEENGQKIETSRLVKKAKPIKCAILKPTRRLFVEAEKFYAIQMAQFITAGLLPYSLVAKRYANDGGPLSEPEKKHLDKLNSDLDGLEQKYFEIVAEQDPKKIDERNQILTRITKINTAIGEVQNAYSDIFENTAEVKSRNRTIEWWVLHLAYIDLDGTGLKPLFGEGDYETKLLKYDEFDEADDRFINECIRKLSYLASFWFAAKTTLTKIDFDSMDKLFTETLSDYRVEDETPEPPAKPTPEPTPQPAPEPTPVTKA